MSSSKWYICSILLQLLLAWSVPAAGFLATGGRGAFPPSIQRGIPFKFIRPPIPSVFITSPTECTAPSLPRIALFGKKDAREQGNDRKNKTERVRKPKDDVIEVEAVVLESLPNAMFRCVIDGAPDTQEPILATISGKIRKNLVKILVGDKVLVELSPYDLTRGRITFRYR